MPEEGRNCGCGCGCGNNGILGGIFGGNGCLALLDAIQLIASMKKLMSF